jgi:hypothetical protein
MTQAHDPYALLRPLQQADQEQVFQEEIARHKRELEAANALISTLIDPTALPESCLRALNEAGALPDSVEVPPEGPELPTEGAQAPQQSLTDLQGATGYTAVGLMDATELADTFLSGFAPMKHPEVRRPEGGGGREGGTDVVLCRKH